MVRKRIPAARVQRIMPQIPMMISALSAMKRPIRITPAIRRTIDRKGMRFSFMIYLVLALLLRGASRDREAGYSPDNNSLVVPVAQVTSGS